MTGKNTAAKSPLSPKGDTKATPYIAWLRNPFRPRRPVWKFTKVPLLTFLAHWRPLYRRRGRRTRVHRDRPVMRSEVRHIDMVQPRASTQTPATAPPVADHVKEPNQANLTDLDCVGQRESLLCRYRRFRLAPGSPTVGMRSATAVQPLLQQHRAGIAAQNVGGQEKV
jgi:hypothetical protein